MRLRLYLREDKFKFDNIFTLMVVIGLGEYDVLRLGEGTLTSQWPCMDTAAGGQLEVLKYYLHNTQGPHGISGVNLRL